MAEALKDGKTAWRTRGMDAWPAALPQGLESPWQGWRREPDFSELDGAGHGWFLREAVRQVLVAQYEAAGMDARALRPLDDPRCRVVTVGHQLVMAGGPAFVHHKVLSAVRTARALAKRHGVPVVPVFWLASEDHDFDEVATVWGRSKAHSWRRPEGCHGAVGRMPLDGVGDVLASWGSDGVQPEESSALCALFRGGQDASLAAWTRRMLHAWYGPHGLVILDADHPELKRLAHPLWVAEMEGNGVAHALRTSGDGGSTGPAHVRDNQLFWMEGAQRRVGMVPREQGGWKAGDAEFVASDWESWAEAHAASCSPGVLLRPLYQEWLLASAAVIVGPGEWAYWHQLPMAFAHHNLAFPALRLRDHAVVVPPRAEALGWDTSHGWLHREAWERWVLDRWMRDHEANLDAVRAHFAKAVLEARAMGDAISPQLTGPTGALEAGLDKAWSQWQKKARRALKESRGDAWRASGEAGEWLVRQGLPQDRWANWHVLAHSLAGASGREWIEAWLAAPNDELGACVWQVTPR